MYGSSRLGVQQREANVEAGFTSGKLHELVFGKRSYELSNHLGNVLATISDRKIGIASSSSSSLIDHYEADVVSAQDYYPFGMGMPGRTYSASHYRYGFNGQEKSNEIKGEGNSYTAEFWEYDPRIGRRWNLDPKPMSGISEYSTFNGNPIWHSDPLGDSSTKPNPVPDELQRRLSTSNNGGGGNGDQKGLIRNAPKEAYASNPVRAAIGDVSHFLLDVMGVNAVDDFIADRINGKNSPGELMVSTVGLGLSTSGPKEKKGPPVKAYEVGLHNELQSRSVVGDNLEIHHVTQTHPSEQIVGGYQRGQGPAISLPKVEHKRIPTERGTTNRTPRQQLAKDIKDLRKHTSAPNESLFKLIDFNKQLFGDAFKK